MYTGLRNRAALRLAFFTRPPAHVLQLHRCPSCARMQELCLASCRLAEPASLLELAQLQQLGQLDVVAAAEGHAGACAVFQAALAELCCRCPSLEVVKVVVEGGEPEDDGASFDWGYAAQHLRAALAMRGRAGVRVGMPSW